MTIPSDNEDTPIINVTVRSLVCFFRRIASRLAALMRIRATPGSVGRRSAMACHPSRQWLENYSVFSIHTRDRHLISGNL
jgi:hypothetical protein